MVCRNLQLLVVGLICLPHYLPASHNFKTVHAQYVAACAGTNSAHVGYSVFKSVWHHCMPPVRLMTPRTDVCAVCLCCV